MMKRNILVLIVIMALFLMVGCDNLDGVLDDPTDDVINDGEDDEVEEIKTGIEGFISLEGRGLGHIPLYVDGISTSTDELGNYQIILPEGEHTLNIITLFGTYKINVQVKQDEMEKYDKTFTYTDWDIEDIMTNKDYYVKNGTSEAYYDPNREKEENFWINSPLYGIVSEDYEFEYSDRMLPTWSYGAEIEYMFENDMSQDYKVLARDIFDNIEKKLDYIITFKEIPYDSSRKDAYIDDPEYSPTIFFEHNTDPDRYATAQISVMPFGFPIYDEIIQGIITLPEKVNKTTLAHEIGHILGLGHLPHKSKNNDFIGDGKIMYYTSQASPTLDFSEESWKILKTMYSIGALKPYQEWVEYDEEYDMYWYGKGQSLDGLRKIETIIFD